MIDICRWLVDVPGMRMVPLFAADETGVVSVKITGDRTLLRRSETMEQAVIEIVEHGLEDPDWVGLLYVMGWGTSEAFRILYVGKAERRGVSRPLSANLENIRKNKHKFARWGDGVAYHIGDLSHAMFEFKAYRRPSAKYRHWASTLFVTNQPPRLREAVTLALLPWYRHSRGPSGLTSSLPAAEKEVIALAGTRFGSGFLNRDGI